MPLGDGDCWCGLCSKWVRLQTVVGADGFEFATGFSLPPGCSARALHFECARRIGQAVFGWDQPAVT